MIVVVCALLHNIRIYVENTRTINISSITVVWITLSIVLSVCIFSFFFIHRLRLIPYRPTIHTHVINLHPLTPKTLIIFTTPPLAFPPPDSPAECTLVHARAHTPRRYRSDFAFLRRQTVLWIRIYADIIFAHRDQTGLPENPYVTVLENGDLSRHPTSV